MRKFASAAALAVVASLGLTAPVASSTAATSVVDGDDHSGHSHTEGSTEFSVRTSENPTIPVDPSNPVVPEHMQDPFLDVFPEPPVEAAIGSPPAAPYPLSDTFLLNTDPGSDKTLYLDFQGGATGDSWIGVQLLGQSGISYPPATLDNDPTTFNSNERRMIQLVWKMVAEDYAPFDVNVTTQYPGDAALSKSDQQDDVFGTRVLFMDRDDLQSACGGCSGAAIKGSSNFDEPYWHDHGNDQIVFINRGDPLSNYRQYGNTASHEVGHWLTLEHDGFGTGGPGTGEYYPGAGNWSTIMGSYYWPQVVQWSQGEYPNFKHGHPQQARPAQDDTKIIGFTFPHRGDDHAAALGAAATPIGYQILPGSITSRTDVDFFRVVHGGTRTATVRVDSISSNLDVRIIVRDKDGVAVAASNPVSGTDGGFGTAPGMAAAITYTTDAARAPYYVTVDGWSKETTPTTWNTSGNYNDYGSLGRYSLQIQ